MPRQLVSKMNTSVLIINQVSFNMLIVLKKTNRAVIGVNDRTSVNTQIFLFSAAPNKGPTAHRPCTVKKIAIGSTTKIITGVLY